VRELLDRLEAARTRGGRQVLDERPDDGPGGRNAELPQEIRPEAIIRVDVHAAGALSADVLLDVFNEGDRVSRESDEVAVLRALLDITLVEDVLGRDGAYLVGQVDVVIVRAEAQ